MQAKVNMFRSPIGDESRSAHPAARRQVERGLAPRVNDDQGLAPRADAAPAVDNSRRNGTGNRGKTGNGLGNTRQARSWQFTLNFRDGDTGENGDAHENKEAEFKRWGRQALLEAFADLGNCEYVFQAERGEEDGRLHFQGCFRSKARSGKWRFSVLRSTFEHFEIGWIHLEVARKWNNLVGYSSKEETRVEGPFSNIPQAILDQCRVTRERGTFEPWQPSDPMEGVVPYMWQQEVEESLQEEPDRRTIQWWWEERGDVGKSTWITSYICRHMGETICVNGKSADVQFALAKHYSLEYQKKIWKEGGIWKPIRVVFMDVPREQGCKINYRVLEDIKNGRFFSGKYESGMVMCAVPHIVVFANSAPDTSKFSEDRWDVHKIEDVDMAPINESEGEEDDTE